MHAAAKPGMQGAQVQPMTVMFGGPYHSQCSQAAIPKGRVGDVQLLQHGQPRCRNRVVCDPFAALHTKACILSQTCHSWVSEVLARGSGEAAVATQTMWQDPTLRVRWPWTTAGSCWIPA